MRFLKKDPFRVTLSSPWGREKAALGIWRVDYTEIIDFDPFYRIVATPIFGVRDRALFYPDEVARLSALELLALEAGGN